jgi:hypothetical protein
MKLDIDATTVPSIWQLADQVPVLEIYADEPFDTSDGQTVLAGSAERGDFCKRVECAVVNNVLSIPTIEQIDSTEDSPTNQLATYSAYIRAVGQEPIPWLLNFPLAPITQPDVLTLEWTSIRIHAEGVTPRRDSDTYTKQQTDDLVDRKIAAAFGVAGILAKGRTDMLAGQAAVASDKVLESSNIQLTGQEVGVSGTLYVSDRVPGEGFTIASQNGADEGKVGWVILAA